MLGGDAKSKELSYMYAWTYVWLHEKSGVGKSNENVYRQLFIVQTSTMVSVELHATKGLFIHYYTLKIKIL